jgi:hypothetical protein
MKTNILILTLLLFIISCKKVKLPDNQSELLIGKWKYVSSSGGMTGNQENANRPEIEYTKYGKYKYKDKKLFNFNNKFEIITINSIYTNKDVYAISYQKEGISQSFLIRNDTLFLRDEATDSYSYTYTRK